MLNQDDYLEVDWTSTGGKCSFIIMIFLVTFSSWKNWIDKKG